MGLYCSCTLTAHFTSTIFSICSSLHTALRQIGLYNCYKDSMLLICLSSATQRMVWWKCDRWMCDHVPGHCCGGTSLRWACMWWSTTTWRHQMKGASGSTQRLCPSSKPPALIKSSESISSSGEHLPSRFQGDAFRCEGISASFIFFIRISVWQILCFFSLSISLSLFFFFLSMSHALHLGVLEMWLGIVKFTFWMKSTKLRNQELVHYRLQTDSLNVWTSSILSTENNTKLAVNSLRTSIQKAYICSQS